MAKKKLPKWLKVSQRGDGGTIYIVFIMFVLIFAAYVMVNGLHPTFEESNQMAQQQQPGGTEFVDGPGNLPSLPPRGSEEWQQQRDCAREARRGVSNKNIKNRGELTVRC